MAGSWNAWWRRDRGWKLTALILGTLWFSIGCNPGTLSMLMMPWVDDKEPPEFKLASKDKEITVAILCNFVEIETRHEVMFADRDLGNVLAEHVRKRCAENKEKIKIVSPALVANYVSNKHLDRRGLANSDIGKHFKADYVLNLEIASIRLFNRGSQFYQGSAEIDLKLYEVNAAQGESLKHAKNYSVQYPNDTRGPIDSGSMDPRQFRTLFINRIAADLTRCYTGTPRKIGADMDN